MSTTGTTITIKTESMEESLPDGDKNCNICFEKIKSEMLVNTPCGHAFCCDCFFEWMKENYTCPCCRTLVIKREENQQRVLAVNRAEIAVQEQEIEELTDDVSNLRRLQKIHKRRVNQLEKNNKKLMGRQMRMRMMLQETREIRNTITKQIRKVIPNNRLKDFTKNFYKNLVNGESEKALTEAKNLIIKASFHEWKKHMSNVLEELCKKHDVSRSASYMDQVLDDMLEAPSTSILCKRTKDEMYIKMITGEIKEEVKEEDKTSGEEEEKTEIEEPRQDPQQQQRRRVRLVRPSNARVRDGAVNIPWTPNRRLANTSAIDAFAELQNFTQSSNITPNISSTSNIRDPEPFPFQMPTEDIPFHIMLPWEVSQQPFIFGQNNEEGNSSIGASADLDGIALRNLFDETEEEIIDID